MKVFVHAGTFKTGSSALQNSLYNQKSNLLQNGVLYPSTGLSEDGDLIGYRHSKFVYEYGKDTYPRLIVDLKREIEIHKPKILILSSEAWSRPEAANSLFDLINHLQTYSTEKISLYFVVRNVFDYAISHYREFVRRWGWSLEFGEYLNQRIVFFDYNQLFKPFLKKNINVKFLPYSQTVNDIIIRDMGIQHLINADLQLRQNFSLTAPDIEIYRRFNILKNELIHKNIPSFNQLLEELGLNTGGNKFIEDPPPIEFLMKFSKKYKRKFESITGLDGSLLDYDLSKFNDPKAICLSKIKPIIDLYFSDNLKRLLSVEASDVDNKMLSQHLTLIQKFNWDGDVSAQSSEKSLTLEQISRLLRTIARVLFSKIKRLAKKRTKKIINCLTMNKD